jgi:hypothetical protein
MSVCRLFVAVGGHETTLSLIPGDIEIDSVTIPGGDAILACYSAAGRDADQYGEGADRFDINHVSGKHLAFGGGIYSCLGASLARLEGILALKGLFTHYPGMTLAADLASLPRCRRCCPIRPGYCRSGSARSDAAGPRTPERPPRHSDLPVADT